MWQKQQNFPQKRRTSLFFLQFKGKFFLLSLLIIRLDNQLFHCKSLQTDLPTAKNAKKWTFVWQYWRKAQIFQICIENLSQSKTTKQPYLQVPCTAPYQKRKQQSHVPIHGWSATRNVEKNALKVYEFIKNSNVDAVVNQNLNNQENFQDLDNNLMCDNAKLESLIHKHPLNSAAGKDENFYEHIINATTSVCFYFSDLFGVCLMHGKIQQQCMKTVKVHTWRNKDGDTSCVGNYRPVSFATTISKLFEDYILSWCITPFVATTDNRFGFKPVVPKLGVNYPWG